MKTSLLPALLAAGALLAAPAHAQQAFQFGPTIGAALATVHAGTYSDEATSARWGFEAGATGLWQGKGHWGGQTAVRYVQQGFVRHATAVGGPGDFRDYLRLNYLRVPLQATFSQHAGGQGLQLVAGPYLGVLLGGRRTAEATYAGSTASQSTRVVVADTHTESAAALYSSSYLPDSAAYSRRFDVGLQGGVGYRLGNALLQVGYTLGLRNLSSTMVYEAGTTTLRIAGEPYRTRGWQVSLTYLLGSQP